MPDSYSSGSNSLDAPARQAAAVTPHDTNELSAHARSLFIGTGGDVVAVLTGDTDAVTFKNVPSGTVLPVRAKIVKSTSTTATDIVALY